MLLPRRPDRASYQLASTFWKGPESEAPDVRFGSAEIGYFRLMSALPPKADMDQWDCDVRFVPKADILHCRRRHWITSSAVAIKDWSKLAKKLRSSDRFNSSTQSAAEGHEPLGQLVHSVAVSRHGLSFPVAHGTDTADRVKRRLVLLQRRSNAIDDRAVKL